MDELIFRAWHKKENKMVDLQKITPLALSIDPMIVGAGIGVYIPDHDDIEVMQYTGVLDKKANKIFEGDIIKFDDTDDIDFLVSGFKALIVKLPGRFVARFSPYDRSTGQNEFVMTEKLTNFIEVVGNKYEK